MKKILLLLTIIMFISCAKDNDDVIDTELEGKWTLTRVSCFCGFGDNPDFSGHKLTFMGNNLNVENSGEFHFLVSASGTYTVSGNILTLKNGQQYTYVVKLNVLELTFVDNPNIADDELFLVYERS